MTMTERREGVCTGVHVQVLSTFSVGDLDGILEDSIHFPPPPANDDSLQEQSLPLRTA